MSTFTADVVLPSKGILYPEDLVPGGQITIRMMSPQEEKLLAGSHGSSSRIITQLLSKLVESPKGLDTSKLLAFDRLFLLINIRVLTFGPSYNFKMRCPECNKIQTFATDLIGDTTVKELPEDFEEPMHFELPLSKKWVKLRFPRGFDEEEIQKISKKNSDRGAALEPGDPAYIPTIARLIAEAEGVDANNFPQKRTFVERLYSLDSVFIQRRIESYDYGVDMSTVQDCPNCGAEIEFDIPISEEFFRPKL